MNHQFYNKKILLLDNNRMSTISINFDFTIVINELLESIAFYLKTILNNLGYSIRIVYDISKEECIESNNHVYIIVHWERKHDLLPKNFIFYQIEQTESKHFNKKHLEMLEKSLVILEFSVKNYFEKYSFIPFSKVFYNPFAYVVDSNHINKIYDTEYDVLFYGAENIRRKSVLTTLGQKYKVKIAFGVLGDLRENLIQKSKIILNLHYYKNASLETCRINEILKYNKIVLSEFPSKEDWFNIQLYDKVVCYFEEIKDDLSNIQNLFQLIDFYLKDNNYNQKLNQIQPEKALLAQKINYIHSKNLIQIMNTKCEIPYHLHNDRIYCLHLIETPFRIEKFKNQDHAPHVEIFPAIKYSPGWVGCGYSYKNLLWNAKRCNLDKLVVCEDDCLFPKDFEKTYSVIQSFLTTMKDWDIFSGCIAELPKNTKIVNIFNFQGITFIELDKIHSTVFTIYNHTCYDKILNWNPNNKNKDTNQIDQYIKSLNLRIITTHPFLFSCINTQSTIENTNNFELHLKSFRNSHNIIESQIKFKLGVCLLYAYFEKNELYKNNFKFFLENGILDHVDYYIIINGHCSVEIPQKKNIKILIRENIGYDFGAYSHGIKNLENNYQYIFFMNTSVCGPYYKDKNWTHYFIPLFSGDVKVVGTSINICTWDHPLLKILYGNGPYSHVQTMFFGITNEYLTYLKSIDFFNQETINQLDFESLIIRKEIGLSQIALKNNWNINCNLMLYKNLDYRNITKDINPTSHEGDPYYQKAFFGMTIEPQQVVFFKNARI